MKKRLFSIVASLFIAFCATSLFAQNPHTVLFYNVENFFDTINDPNSDDRDFTPKGKYRWTADKYVKKLGNVERVISDVALANENFPTVIGFAEIESRGVLEDIASTPSLSVLPYQIIHYDSPDRRGIDVAFVYREDVFVLDGSCAERIVIPDDPDFRTRDILTMWGKIENEPFFFMVAHWPSRLGGEERTEHLRIAAAAKMRSIADSVRVVRPSTKFVLMGDFNDNSNDRSVEELLGAKGLLRKMGVGDFYNPFYKLFMAGYGTSAYDGEWNLFDNIVVSENLVDGVNGGLTLQSSIYNIRYDGNIFKPQYLIQTEGRYKGYPFRTFSWRDFIGGYSDHLPVFINID